MENIVWRGVKEKSQQQHIVKGFFQGYGEDFRRWLITDGKKGNFGEFTQKKILYKTFNTPLDKKLDGSSQTVNNNIKKHLKQEQAKLRSKQQKVLGIFKKVGIKNLQDLQDAWKNAGAGEKNEKSMWNVVIATEKLLTEENRQLTNKKFGGLSEELQSIQEYLVENSLTIHFGDKEYLIQGSNIVFKKAFNTLDQNNASYYFHIIPLFELPGIKEEIRKTKKGREVAAYSLNNQLLEFEEAIKTAFKETGVDIKARKDNSYKTKELKQLLKNPSMIKQVQEFLLQMAERTDAWNNISGDELRKKQLSDFYDEVAKDFCKTWGEGVSIKSALNIKEGAVDFEIQEQGLMGFTGELSHISAVLRIKKNVKTKQEDSNFSIEVINTGRLKGTFGQFNQDTILKLTYQEKGREEEKVIFGLQAKNPYDVLTLDNYPTYKEPLSITPDSKAIPFYLGLDEQQWNNFVQITLNAGELTEIIQEIEKIFFLYAEKFMRIEADTILVKENAYDEDPNKNLSGFNEDLNELLSGNAPTLFFIVGREMVSTVDMLQKLLEAFEEIEKKAKATLKISYEPAKIIAERPNLIRLEENKNLLANARIKPRTIIPLFEKKGG